MRLGCAEIEITPNLPINMGGYGARKLPGSGVATHLFARGFVLEHEQIQTGLITADLIMLNRNQVQEVKAEASRLTGIPIAHIVVSCSHTHSGPSTFSLSGLGNPPDTIYINWLLKALAGSLLMARDNLEPVQIGYQTAVLSGISANRRQPDQAVDSELTVVGFQREAGDLKALLFNFPCHPTVLGADNLLISSEYPGFAVATVKKVFPGAVIGFLNGACGDISTRFVRLAQNHEEVERLGTILGTNVAALAAALTFDAADLAADMITIPVELKPVVASEVIEDELAQRQKQLQTLQTDGAPPAELRQAQTALEGAMIQKHFAAVRDQLETEAELNLWRIGPIGLVTIPGELFSSLGRQIKNESPFSATIVAGYSNGHLGYIPSTQAYEQASYETLSSPLVRGFGERLVASATAGLKALD